MSNYIVDGADLTSVANAIRTKGGTSAQLRFPAGFVSAVEAIPTGGSGVQWELIGTKTLALPEYTDTASAEATDTQINISNTDYAWFLTVVTCDTPITTANEWGMTVSLGGCYMTNWNYYSGVNIMQKGSAALSKVAMASSTSSADAFGVRVKNNTSNIELSRKCHSTACPKCRAGNYIVTVYGLKSL